MKQTALITGASSGIGYALAKCFAHAGYDLVLIARNQTALFALAKECQAHAVSVSVIVKDLTDSQAAQQIYQTLEDQKIIVDILVNNAGMGLWGAFNETAVDDEEQLIALNILAVIRLTKLFIPAMIKRRSGKILNVGSVYSYTPVPYQSTYGASKAFLLSFSAAIRNELKDYGITVTILCPGITTQTHFRTRLGNTKEKSYLSLTAEQVALAGYQGLLKNKAVVIPGFVNTFYVNIMRFMPAKLVAWAVYVFRGLKIPKNASKAQYGRK